MNRICAYFCQGNSGDEGEIMITLVIIRQKGDYSERAQSGDGIAVGWLGHPVFRDKEGCELFELKNLRPQLYSAAEYCEKSYLHNEHKQMVLDNLKDYAVRALVNAVDHLGTVAYKLTDLFEQQTMDISTIEFKISCLDQRRLTCQTYVDKEGLRQQQIFSNTLRHHRRYILPNSVIREEQNQSPQTQSKPRPDPSGTPATKTLSWYLALETSSAAHRATNATVDSRDSKPAKLASEFFHLLDPKETASSLRESTHLQSSSGAKDHLEVSKPLSAFKSFDNPRRKLFRAPVRNKSMLALFLAKKKALKPKKSDVR